ncbi:hypothetical protein DOTSEDRAFT_56819 [Dothistroma septosporum NZE10]|uniref:F-box domain-containing protein n=1 Tax=Dothistroma septosporum (strain NZE10 / CBS 128990) TaxID=675120 RepID=M2YKD5_DOTSN|nr:hypothetical protein DOTSEDRAFT_56819 [Dothistroma septosporum NZE10]
MGDPDPPEPPRDDTTTGYVAKASRLLSLPQELQDIIFAFAFPAHESLDFLTHSQWESREKETRRKNTDHVLRPFPAPKVDDFFVCKQYFACAARAWVTNQHFTNDSGQAFHDIDRNCGVRATEIIRPNVTKLTLNYWLSW